MSKTGPKVRDTVAVALCNFILRRLATKKYRDSLDHLIADGIKSRIEGQLVAHSRLTQGQK